MKARMTASLELRDVGKSFTMHLQGGLRLSVLAGISFAVQAGECVVLDGRSGLGKSTVLKMIFGNYRCDSGQILVRHDGEVVDVATATPRQMLQLRRRTIGYVSQFLRAVPRVPAIDVVAEPLLLAGTPPEVARNKSAEMLHELNIPETLWRIPPATFSGGEQQRVNIARALIAEHPILLLDEPTASLDAQNRSRVLALLAARRAAGTAMVGTFHDGEARSRVATHIFNLPERSEAA
jgi:alpha-D-ribose 1-methylphosphonate 5-triphosphate synthase subunit PhnL